MNEAKQMDIGNTDREQETERHLLGDGKSSNMDIGANLNA